MLAEEAHDTSTREWTLEQWTPFEEELWQLGLLWW